jgi:hypothetical protein
LVVDRGRILERDIASLPGDLAIVRDGTASQRDIPVDGEGDVWIDNEGPSFQGVGVDPSASPRSYLSQLDWAGRCEESPALDFQSLDFQSKRTIVTERKRASEQLIQSEFRQPYLFSGSGRRKSGVFERMESLTGFDASPTRRRLLCTNCKIPGIFSHSPWAK